MAFGLMENFTPVERLKSLIPATVVVVGVYKDDGQPNFSVAAAAATVCSNPPILSVSFRPATLTHSLLGKQKEFTIGIVSSSRVIEIDYVGTRTGATEDKAASVGWPTAKATKVNAPYSSVFGLVYQCRLVDSQNLGSHTIFYGEVIELNIREDCVDETGTALIGKLDPVLFNFPDLSYRKVVGESFAPAFEIYKTIGK